VRILAASLFVMLQTVPGYASNEGVHRLTTGPSDQHGSDNGREYRAAIGEQVEELHSRYSIFPVGTSNQTMRPEMRLKRTGPVTREMTALPTIRRVP
jgi:hypothetical protein